MAATMVDGKTDNRLTGLMSAQNFACIIKRGRFLHSQFSDFRQLPFHSFLACPGKAQDEKSMLHPWKGAGHKSKTMGVVSD